MAKFETLEINNKSKWEKFVLTMNPRSFLQSWSWGETNRSQGFKIVRLGFYKNNKLVGVAQLIHQPAKRGPHFLIPGGPLIDWDDKELARYVTTEIKRIGRENKVWFVRLRAELMETIENQKLLSGLGFNRAPMHLHAESTYVLDITKNEEEILANMRKNTRYEVRKSLNENLKVVQSRDPKFAKLLFDLQEETIKRNNFVAFSRNYYEAQISAFASEGLAEVFIVYDKKEPVVCALIIFYGDSVYYHHSGSSDKARSDHASYRLQWEVIKEAKKRNKARYDMWGASPEGNTKHRFYGPSLFKKGFGGDRIDWLKTQDIPISKLYWTTYMFEFARKTLRRL